MVKIAHFTVGKTFMKPSSYFDSEIQFKLHLMDQFMGTAFSIKRNHIFGISNHDEQCVLTPASFYDSDSLTHSFNHSINHSLT